MVSFFSFGSGNKDSSPTARGQSNEAASAQGASSEQAPGGMTVDVSAAKVSSCSPAPISASAEEQVKRLFAAIAANDLNTVRELLAANPSLASRKQRGGFAYPSDVELDALKFLGAYIGSMNPLHYAILLSHEEIALEIIEAIFTEDIDATFGGNNTALHLAVFMAESEIVAALLVRGADWELENSKGFTACDLVTDDEIRQILASAEPAQQQTKKSGLA